MSTALPVVNGRFLRGVEANGKLHRDFEMRPLLVRDSEKALKAMADIKSDSQVRLQCELFAQQFNRIGDLVRGQITGEMLLDLVDSDFQMLKGLDDDLQKKMADAIPKEG